VTINGERADSHFQHCFPGDVVEAWYPEPESGVQPEAHLEVRVLYEDDWLLAVDKPAGQLSHPARSEQTGTIANAVAARYAERRDGSVAGDLAAAGAAAAGAGVAVRPVRLAHRLDRDTSGVLLFARDAATARALTRQRAAGVLRREYLALVSGLPAATGVIDLWLGPDPAHRTRQLTHAAPSTGAQARPGGHDDKASGMAARALPAQTTYRVVQYGPRCALVAATLQTGRTHQIRAHFAGTGHPLVGDELYGGPGSTDIRRQALHAWRVRLRHPASGRPLAIVAPIPADFATAARRRLRAG
jgi:23S rRNA pseudouridine1911/1915/1917 synthase